ncbi:hypothetical protein [Pedobacter cryoconitis]|uniref:hypothetical protein n=1 Tax=Pedobacter cryoconitis TaxID=188932 RepID=UPI00160DFDB0|nr:hypothetical protein [Pedobacter cryoconitis]MBB5644897.1 hypothetical protein [Pedobacter cryoconitis]
MGINKPYHRNYRKLKEAPSSGSSSWAYIVDHNYAQHPEHYIRAFSVIQQDILNLFESIEPSDINGITYSFRIHSLLMRTCIELEANFKAILKENTYNPVIKKGSNMGSPRADNTWTINDFKLVNKTHHLDDYKVELPFWDGIGKDRRPFEAWKRNESLSWYKAYNDCKHDRLKNFPKANLENLINAYCGLFVLLSSQFRTESFSPGSIGLGVGPIGYYKGNFGIGEFLMITFPGNWDENEMYDFNWSKLGEEQDRFQKINYDLL